MIVHNVRIVAVYLTLKVSCFMYNKIYYNDQFLMFYSLIKRIYI